MEMIAPVALLMTIHELSRRLYVTIIHICLSLRYAFAGIEPDIGLHVDYLLVRALEA